MTPDIPPHPPSPCPACNGNGTIVMSLCCGRGCATCPGDGMMRALDCERCGGSGQQAATPTAAASA
jgi:DnaJ-class molecular chaperone